MYFTFLLVLSASHENGEIQRFPKNLAIVVKYSPTKSPIWKCHYLEFDQLDTSFCGISTELN